MALNSTRPRSRLYLDIFDRMHMFLDWQLGQCYTASNFNNWLQTHWTSCRIGLYHCLMPTCFLWASHLHPIQSVYSQGYTLISSTGCTCSLIDGWVGGQYVTESSNETKSIMIFFEMNLSFLTYIIYSVCIGWEAWGSIPGRVIPKIQRVVLDASLINTQRYKGKVLQSRESSSALPYNLV